MARVVKLHEFFLRLLLHSATIGGRKGAKLLIQKVKQYLPGRVKVWVDGYQFF